MTRTYKGYYKIVDYISKVLDEASDQEVEDMYWITYGENGMLATRISNEYHHRNRIRKEGDSVPGTTL